MGQGNAVGFTRDVINGESYRADSEMTERTVVHIFDKCIDRKKISEEHVLSGEERNCVEEYAMHYSNFVRGAFPLFQQLYLQHAKELYEKARMEALAAQKGIRDAGAEGAA